MLTDTTVLRFKIISRFLVDKILDPSAKNPKPKFKVQTKYIFV